MNTVVEVIETYDAMRDRAKRAGKRKVSDRDAWAKEATIALLNQDRSGDPALEAALVHSALGDCCGNAAWRGHLCQYHEGYEDGYDKALEAVK